MDTLMTLLIQSQTLLGSVFSHQITQFTIAFSLAAFVHSNQMRKEIATQMSSVVASIKEIGEALKADLKAQSSRLENVEIGFTKLTTRVDKLEIIKELPNVHSNR